MKLRIGDTRYVRNEATKFFDAELRGIADHSTRTLRADQLAGIGYVVTDRKVFGKSTPLTYGVEVWSGEAWEPQYQW